MSLFDPDGMQEVLYGRIRLLVLAALSKKDILDFVELRDMLKVQDGSLAHALKKLSEVNFVKIDKGRDENGKSRTTVTMTATGRRALLTHLRDMQDLAQSLRTGGSFQT